MREGGVAVWKSTHDLCACATTVKEGMVVGSPASSNERRGTCGAPHIISKSKSSTET